LLIIFRPLVTPLLHPRVALAGCGSYWQVLRDAIGLDIFVFATISVAASRIEVGNSTQLDLSRVATRLTRDLVPSFGGGCGPVVQPIKCQED
jgi:hypothetical protein